MLFPVVVTSILRYYNSCVNTFYLYFEKVLTNDGSEVGKITKQWSGLAREAFTDSDNFGVTFPMDLDVRCKITLLAAVFLIVSYHIILYYLEYLFRIIYFLKTQRVVGTHVVLDAIHIVPYFLNIYLRFYFS